MFPYVSDVVAIESKCHHGLRNDAAVFAGLWLGGKMNGLFVCEEVSCFFPCNSTPFLNILTHFVSKLDEVTLTTRTYRGEMHNNERHGLGVLLDADGSVLKYALHAPPPYGVNAQPVHYMSCCDMCLFGSCTVTLGNMQGTWCRGHLQSSHQLPRQLLADVITVCIRKLFPRILLRNTDHR